MASLSHLQSVLLSVEFVRNMVKGNQELHVKLKTGLEAIKCELALLSDKVRKTLEENNQGAKPQEWILQLQNLAYDIEDFIYERGRDPRSPAPVRLVQVAMVIDPRPTHLECINDFKERIKSILTTFRESPITTPPPVVDAPPPPNSAPLGMEQPKQDLTRLLLAAENELKVVSIVGCSGVGKTTLAWQLYNDSSVMERFLHRAWVEVLPSVRDAGSLLYSVLLQLIGGPQQQEPESGWDVCSLTTQLKNFLLDKRYLVIIDGVRENDPYWTDVIRPALPENNEGSRIVLTTSIRSVATGCSSGSYLYSMRGLDRTHSEDLFWTKLGRQYRPPALVDGLETFFHKCDGLPLLLVGSAEFLRRHGTALTDEHCRRLGDDLRKHLAGVDPAFRKTRTSLEQCCDSMSDYWHKACMLSVCAFPKGHQINRKSLIRRWIAEGLVVGDAQQKVACEYLDKMRDLNIIEPASPHSNHTKMKRCQVHGVMLEFLVQQSVSWNFITLIKEHEVVRNHETSCSARRISVHAGEIDRREIDLSRIRSLTVCNTEYHLRLESCKLLRVLDLEGCRWLSNDHLGVICGLLYLKYLSVRHTQVSELPRAIKDLQWLETLDVRQTQVDKLPLQVLKLPQLLHLFGKFELPHQLGDANRAERLVLENFFSEESKLQTLSGFKIVNNGGFKLLLLHLKMLRKVKIWCEVPPSSPPPASWDRIRNTLRKKRKNIVSANNLSAYLVEPLQKRFVGSNALDSLSVDFGGLCRDFLASALQDGYAVSSLKVSGEMQGLPQSPALTSVRHIKELHLCKTRLPIVELSLLQSLPCLVYLKLVEKPVENHTDFWNGIFAVEADGFPSLQQLCFDGPRLPEVKFSPKTVTPLLSLQLICPEPNDNSLGVTGIEHLGLLNEVILHPHASPEKMESWLLEADRHTNRPYVKMQEHNDGA